MKPLDLLLNVIVVFTLGHTTALAQAPPREWVEGGTGHRVIRLSGDEGGSSLYFHQNVYTPKGDKLIFDTRAGIAVVDVGKLGQPLAGTARPASEPVKVEIVVPEARAISMAFRTSDVYYRKGGTLYATNVETR